MYPDAMTTSAQTGNAVPRPRRAPMGWGEVLVTVSIYSIFFFARYYADHQMSWGKLFNSHVYVLDAIVAIAVSFGIAGNLELIRGGHWTNRRILLVVSYLIWIFGVVGLFFIKWRRGFEIPFLGVITLLASAFPCARFLNRKQNKSTPQPAMDNAG
jgi:hypothetical protein